MVLPPEQISSRIFIVREHRVMLDQDLATLYAVSTGALVQAVKRNPARFPADFMFQLTEQELTRLKSQSVISKMRSAGRGGRRSLPYAFSEQGVAMLSTVLRTERAIAVNIAIMRAFVRLRLLAAANLGLAKKLDDLERRVSGHDEAITSIVRAIRELAAPAPSNRRRIGFV
ncbi:MAG: ORF6N domain-containing protein [Betaproteobacteria bacterium]